MRKETKHQFKFASKSFYNKTNDLSGTFFLSMVQEANGKSDATFRVCESI